MVRPAVQLDLLQKKRHARFGALVSHTPRPVEIHGPGAGACFRTENYPVQTARPKKPHPKLDRPQAGFDTHPAHGGGRIEQDGDLLVGLELVADGDAEVDVRAGFSVVSEEQSHTLWAFCKHQHDVLRTLLEGPEDLRERRERDPLVKEVVPNGERGRLLAPEFLERLRRKADLAVEPPLPVGQSAVARADLLVLLVAAHVCLSRRPTVRAPRRARRAALDQAQGLVPIHSCGYSVWVGHLSSPPRSRASVGARRGVDVQVRNIVKTNCEFQYRLLR